MSAPEPHSAPEMVLLPLPSPCAPDARDQRACAVVAGYGGYAQEVGTSAAASHQWESMRRLSVGAIGGRDGGRRTCIALDGAPCGAVLRLPPAHKRLGTGRSFGGVVLACCEPIRAPSVAAGSRGGSQRMSPSARSGRAHASARLRARPTVRLDRLV